MLVVTGKKQSEYYFFLSSDIMINTRLLEYKSTESIEMTRRYGETIIKS